MKNNFWKITTLALTVFLALSLTTNVILLLKGGGNKISAGLFTGQADSSLIKTVSAREIYPMFECPCCGKSIDQCTCPMAKERKEYVDFLVGTKPSEDEIVLSYVKKYGLNSFMDKTKQKEVREKLVAVAPDDRPVISLSPSSYDFGDVSQKEGIMTIPFDLKNEGKSDLIIDRLETSCGCTSASIVYQNEEGPIFTMPGHDNDVSTNWQVVIPAGKTAQVKVYYDPNVHEDFRGTAIREISVFSNDPIDFEKSVKIELNQID